MTYLPPPQKGLKMQRDFYRFMAKTVGRLFKRRRQEIILPPGQTEHLLFILGKALDGRLAISRREKAQTEFWNIVGKDHPQVLNGPWHIVIDRVRGALTLRQGRAEEWK